MKGFGYIYKTTNLINGRIYIGQKSGTFSPSYLGSGWILIKALHKYGKNNFKIEVIAYATSKKMLNSLEIKYISKYRQIFGREFLYNITDGGEGKCSPCSEKSKKKIGDANRRPNYKLRGISFNILHKEKLSKAWIERRKRGTSKETIKKMIKSHLGIKHKPEVCSKMSKLKIAYWREWREKNVSNHE